MSQFDFQCSLRILILLITSLILSACTTMEARLSLDPYTKDKQKRNAVELIAEQYCDRKRNYPGATTVKKQPDFIFTTDGCSRAPDDGWVECCIVHDIPYWCGGSEADRKSADQFLKQCLNKEGSFFDGLFYAVVRLGGAPWLPAPWRWGYGWEDWPRDYEPLEHSPSATQLLDDLHIEQEVQKHLQK
jgi:hypothetical protein